MLILPNTLTIEQARVTLGMLEAAIAGDTQSTLVVDAAGLGSFDSAAVAVLLACRRKAAQAGRGFALRAAPAKLTELIQLYGVESLLADTAPQA